MWKTAVEAMTRVPRRRSIPACGGFGTGSNGATADRVSLQNLESISGAAVLDPQEGGKALKMRDTGSHARGPEYNWGQPETNKEYKTAG